MKETIAYDQNMIPLIEVEVPDPQYPLPVAKDWDQQVAKANLLAGVIDQHLGYERDLQGDSMGPVELCPQQKSDLATDLMELTKE